MKKTIFTLAILLAASTAAFADETDPNPQPAPSSSATITTGCGIILTNVPAPEQYEGGLLAAIADYEQRAKDACNGDAGNWTWNRN